MILVMSKFTEKEQKAMKRQEYLKVSDRKMRKAEACAHGVVTIVATMNAVYVALMLCELALTKWPDAFSGWSFGVVMGTAFVVETLVAYAICGPLWRVAYESYFGLMSVEQVDAAEPVGAYDATNMVRVRETTRETKTVMAVVFVLYLAECILSGIFEMQMLWNVLNYMGIAAMIVTALIAWCEVRIIAEYPEDLLNEVCRHNELIIAGKDAEIEQTRTKQEAESVVDGVEIDDEAAAESVETAGEHEGVNLVKADNAKCVTETN